MKGHIEHYTLKFFRSFGLILASSSVSFVSQTFLGLGIMNKFLLLSLCERFSHNARIAPLFNRTICSKLTSKSLESNS